ncbi:hypothetical protein F2P79_009040 [Pimephales promelas]|nr:hypothetical protein F2P79_009040 [Pimephales promelas]
MDSYSSNSLNLKLENLKEQKPDHVNATEDERRVCGAGGVGILNEVLLVRRRAHTDPSYGGVGLKVRELIHHAVSCCSGVPNLSVCERPEQRADKYTEMEGGYEIPTESLQKHPSLHPKFGASLSMRHVSFRCWRGRVVAEPFAPDHTSSVKRYRCYGLLLSRSSHRILQDGVCDVCFGCVMERRDGPASPLMRDRWLVAKIKLTNIFKMTVWCNDLVSEVTHSSEGKREMRTGLEQFEGWAYLCFKVCCVRVPMCQCASQGSRGVCDTGRGTKREMIGLSQLRNLTWLCCISMKTLPSKTEAHAAVAATTTCSPSPPGSFSPATRVQSIYLTVTDVGPGEKGKEKRKQVGKKENGGPKERAPSTQVPW